MFNMTGASFKSDLAIENILTIYIPEPMAVKMIFTQSELDDFLQQIKEKGFTKLVDAALFHGLSVDYLTSQITAISAITSSPFEGFASSVQNGDLQPGMYNGQHINGLRDGYGLLFTKLCNCPCLYECQWDKGKPIKGKWINRDDKQWSKYEGPFDELCLATGTGNYQSEDGETYQGEYKRGKRHGYGKVTYPSGKSYDGQWQNNNKHGQGRYTYSSGRYEEGQWKDSKKVGEHKKYSKEGTLRELITYEDDKKVKREKVQ
ncbi:hypothetical protein FGO68_gene1538 [Halteria grandinella]|uniref:Uncharacterized protein n=1 Tax=Halteria grandinella TaxID=5974 RepID=A0A8J8NUU2_HALGN|nr:hypothetical protein FGO68_gene1538 [Halteria grandinella]